MVAEVFTSHVGDDVNGGCAIIDPVQRFSGLPPATLKNDILMGTLLAGSDFFHIFCVSIPIIIFMELQHIRNGY